MLEFGSATWVEDLGFEGVVILDDVLPGLVGGIVIDTGVASMLL